MTINEYRDRYYKVFKRVPNVVLVFIELYVALFIMMFTNVYLLMKLLA